MATIPVEVIIQDAESPVTPTPESGEETSITVPDTGTINSNGDPSSSASSIILPAILLVLAIGSIVAILIHKYHKQKKDKTTRKEKLAIATSSTIAILAVTVLIGNLVIPATKAATSDITDGITPSEDKISIVVTRDGGAAEASIESTATVTSTSDFGYKVLLSMAEGVETSNLYLDGDETSEHYIAPVEVSDDESEEEGTVLADNTWGYALTEDGEYSAIPLLDDAIVVAQGDEPVEDEVLNIYYGVKVSSDLPAGTYSGGEVEYAAVANPIPSTIGELIYMQDFARLPEENKISVLTSMNEDQQYNLRDNRDNKSYSISKLKDGNIWMTQNLDLQKEDLIDGVVLNSSNTNNPVIGFTLPDSQTSGGGGWVKWGVGEDDGVNTAHIYNPSEATIFSSSDFGNYYNWYSVTAATGTSELGWGVGGVATGSICPAGWRLPKGNTSSGITEFGTLMYSYGAIAQSTSSEGYNSGALLNEPFKMVLTGMYEGGLEYVGERGYLWSSVAYSDANYGAYSAFLTGGGYANPWTNIYMFNGLPVRCVAE